MAGTAWGGVAEARGKWGEKMSLWTRAATETMLEAARLRPDMRVLDLASGPGEPALSIAAALSQGGNVVATDPAPEMLTVVCDRAAAKGLTSLACRKAEAEHLPFPSATFDLVTCRFGVMYFTDPGRASREIHRVLVGGGRAVLMAWGPWQDSDLFPATMAVVARHLPGPVDIAANPQFSFANPERLAELLRQAGFHHVLAEFRDVPWCWPGTAEEAWQCVQETTASAFRGFLSSIPEDRRAQVDREVLAAMRAFESEGRLRFRARLVLGCGEKN